MKKRLTAILITLMLLAFAIPAYAVDSVQTLKPDVDPVIVNGNTLVPVRALAEWMGFPVKFEPNTQAVKVGDMQLYQNTGANSDSFTYPLILSIGKMKASVKGASKELEVPPIIWNGSTLIPLRFFSESLGAKLSWNGDTKEITFDYQGKKAKLVVPPQSDDTTASLEATVSPLIKTYQFEKTAMNGPLYKELEKSPTKYKDKPAYFFGQVFQAIEDSDGATLLLLDVNFGGTQQLVAVMSATSMNDVQEGDFVNVYGICSDPYTYITKSEYRNTVPALILTEYSKRKVTADSGTSATQQGADTDSSVGDFWAKKDLQQISINLKGDKLELVSPTPPTSDIQIKSIQIESYSLAVTAPVRYGTRDNNGIQFPFSSFTDKNGNVFPPKDKQLYFVKVVTQSSEITKFVQYDKNGVTKLDEEFGRHLNRLLEVASVQQGSLMLHFDTDRDFIISKVVVDGGYKSEPSKPLLVSRSTGNVSIQLSDLKDSGGNPLSAVDKKFWQTSHNVTVSTMYGDFTYSFDSVAISNTPRLNTADPTPFIKNDPPDDSKSRLNTAGN
ncbi:copper amine oxidase N-terminal domain-containing protein [Paenibacillus alginolyticus]|uniref:stalk domain-containing protein n=1 Tax=Paenibacillus alginolyticus TaxID=59839 RepID=UPI00040CAA52|nr:copper amine oxidase N-terminal domain-containing protein [Paenibacillus alginolyticus]MCY9664902.1 copper amine oxidase N-terminal domain-containing protein [Paenibacillus alginolyticus]